MKTIIKYKNRKLYDKQNKKYTTIDELEKEIRFNSIKVIEHHTKNDITKEIYSAIAEKKLNKLNLENVKDFVDMMQYL
jgi:polyhydroxyalkanoate synthesis regulator protein